MNKALTNGFQTYTWWYIRRSYGPMKEDGTNVLQWSYGKDKKNQQWKLEEAK